MCAARPAIDPREPFGRDGAWTTFLRSAPDHLTTHGITQERLDLLGNNCCGRGSRKKLRINRLKLLILLMSDRETLHAVQRALPFDPFSSSGAKMRTDSGLSRYPRHGWLSMMASWGGAGSPAF